MRITEILIDDLVHRGFAGARGFKGPGQPVWHVRDGTRRIRQRTDSIVLADAQPAVFKRAMRAQPGSPEEIKRFGQHALSAKHYAYISGRPAQVDVSQLGSGRPLKFVYGIGFVYADSNQPFTNADFVQFNPDGSVMAYNSAQTPQPTGAPVTVEPAAQTSQ